jgi:nucleoside-diphosphate-sugar epimerase
VITTVLIGADDPLRERVRALLDASEARGPLVVIDDPTTAGPDLKTSLDGADELVLLSGGLDGTRAVLDAAGSAAINRLVVLSTATVYGAWDTNPVPLTEDATLRPNPDLEFAVRGAERERLVAEWRAEHPSATVAVLRPATPGAEGVTGWLADGLRAAASVRAAGPDDPPAQFVHLDDLAAAVVVALEKSIDGPRNVAPDGWIAGEEVRALLGGPRVRVPAAIAKRTAVLRWRLGVAPAPPGLVPYTVHPWVVANDRLRSDGWVPAHSNEEALVAGTPASPWANVSPQRRQELALGAAVAAIAGVAVGAFVLIRRARRRSRT